MSLNTQSDLLFFNYVNLFRGSASEDSAEHRICPLNRAGADEAYDDVPIRRIRPCRRA